VKAPRAFVVDTSVVVAGLLTADPSSPTAVTVDGMLEARFVFLLSEELLIEYRKVLLRPAVRDRHGLDEREVDEILAEIVRNGIVREPPASDGRRSPAPDPGDQHLWDLVSTDSGAALVAGDRALLEEPPEGTWVLEPSDFVVLVR
jgi:predicted nucleic acid-binding protein